MSLYGLIILALLVECFFFAQSEVLKGTFTTLPDKYRFGFSPFVGHVMHEFLFRLSNISKLEENGIKDGKKSGQDSLYLQDFVNMNYGRVPGSYTKGDFFPTKKSSMAAKHFSMEDHVFLLHSCHEIRQYFGDSKVGDLVDEVFMNSTFEDERVNFLREKYEEILKYFEHNEEYKKSLQHDYNVSITAKAPLKELDSQWKCLKVMGNKLDAEMLRITKAKILFEKNSTSFEGLKIFLHDNQTFSCSSEDFSHSGLGQKLQNLYQSLVAWHGDDRARDLIQVKVGSRLSLSSDVSEIMEFAMGKLSKLIGEMKAILDSAQTVDPLLLEEYNKFVHNLESRHAAVKKKWNKNSFDRKVSYAPPKAIFYAEKFVELNQKLREYRDLIASFMYPSDGASDEISKKAATFMEKLKEIVEKEENDLNEILKNFRETLDELGSKRDDAHSKYLNSTVCDKSNNFDDCFEAFQKKNLAAYIKTMFYALLGSTKQERFAKFTAESVLLSIVSKKFLLDSNAVQKYFDKVKIYQPDFSLSPSNSSHLYETIESEGFKSFQFSQIPYGYVSVPNAKSITFPNCMEAVVRDIVRLLVQSRNIEPVELPKGIEEWTERLSDKPNIVYTKVVLNENVERGKFMKESFFWPYGTVSQLDKTNQNLKLKVVESGFLYEMYPSILNLFVAIDMILDKGFFKDWDISNFTDGMERGKRLLSSLNAKIESADADYNKVKISLLRSPCIASFDFCEGKHGALTIEFPKNGGLDSNLNGKTEANEHFVEFLKYVISSPSNSPILIDESVKNNPFYFFNTLSQILLECASETKFFDLFMSTFEASKSDLIPFRKYILGSIHESEVASSSLRISAELIVNS